MKLYTCVATTSLSLMVIAMPLKADMIDPELVETSLPLERSTVINKTVTIESGPPVSATVDVVFLSDTTSSMSDVIRQVQNNARAILGELSNFGSARFGVAEYRDYPNEAFAYRMNTPLTTDTAAVVRGLGQWSAVGGGDVPEANLYGIHETATKMNWREQSVKVILWFGDAPGHDPSRGVTMAHVKSVLDSKSIVVHPIDSGNLNRTGQARDIANHSGGSTWRVDRTDGVASALIGAVESTLENYNEVSLDFGDEPLGLGISVKPDKYSGEFKRDTDREFEFELRLEAFKPGLYEFEVDALVDGSPVATETDRITVPNEPPVRE